MAHCGTYLAFLPNLSFWHCLSGQVIPHLSKFLGQHKTILLLRLFSEDLGLYARYSYPYFLPPERMVLKWTFRLCDQVQMRWNELKWVQLSWLTRLTLTLGSIPTFWVTRVLVDEHCLKTSLKQNGVFVTSWKATGCHIYLANLPQ